MTAAARRFVFRVKPPRLTMTLAVGVRALTTRPFAPPPPDVHVLLGPKGADGAPTTTYGFSFGDASPFAFATVSAGRTVARARVVIDTPFNGVGASLSVGTEMDPGLLMPATGLLVGETGIYESSVDFAFASATPIFLTIQPGAGATAGAGRIIIEY